MVSLVATVVLLFAGVQLSVPMLIPSRPGHQVPIRIESSSYSSLASASGPGWMVHEQDEHTCDAGSRNFAGRVNISDTKSMFFWFFESRQRPNERPVTVWLNGGPGASSTSGMYGEVGPCTINKDHDGTVFSEYSWTNHSNLLIIDQPAGVGLSTVRGALPAGLLEASADFEATLKVILENILPQYASNPLYIAGESYGGQYVPYFAADIVRHQKESSPHRLLNTPLAGIILVNALVDNSWLSLGQYELFCTDNEPNVLRFNETVCDAMAAAAPECERLGALCRTSDDPYICLAAAEFCMENLDIYFQAEVDALRRSPYDFRRDCPDPPLCGVGDNGMGSTEKFLNRPEIQTRLGFDSPVNFIPINFDMNTLWASNPAIFLPATKYLTYLLDGGNRLHSFGARNVGGEHSNASVAAAASVPVLVINGEYDVGCNAPGTLLTYDHLPWHGQAAFRATRSLDPWYWTDVNGQVHKGGLWKGAASGTLAIATVHDAGHMAPGDQRGAVAALFGRWIAGSGSLG
ncbi:hypothetical protein ABOM_003344 [Aspergillus bombycis]|uniref:Carboxypeptidase n=1 Tax=Aspergillus bombycis TaxID=109264 RepID=A0A1F8A8Q2_9EURO|nr:hypothetical protein ABOM_003344 [Aspergillus bombycis]OGM47809.1 hypothetical protein ABOM_003344 [Aspergillus bombycis]